MKYLTCLVRKKILKHRTSPNSSQQNFKIRISKARKSLSKMMKYTNSKTLKFQRKILLQVTSFCFQFWSLCSIGTEEYYPGDTRQMMPNPSKTSIIIGVPFKLGGWKSCRLAHLTRAFQSGKLGAVYYRISLEVSRSIHICLTLLIYKRPTSF